MISPDLQLNDLELVFPQIEIIDIRGTYLCVTDTRLTYTILSDCYTTTRLDYTTTSTPENVRGETDYDDLREETDEPLTTTSFPRTSPHLRRETLPTVQTSTTWKRSSNKRFKPFLKETVSTPHPTPHRPNQTTSTFDELQTTSDPDIAALELSELVMLIIGIILLLIAIGLVMSSIINMICLSLRRKKKPTRESFHMKNSQTSYNPNARRLSDIPPPKPHERKSSFSESINSLSSLAIFTKQKMS